MRIAHITDRFQIGGGLEHIYQIARGMPQHRFIVLARGGSQTHKFEALPNTRICREGYSPEQIGKHKPDLVHIHHTRPLAALLSGRKRIDAPVITTVHGLHLRRYRFRNTPLNKLKYQLRYRLERSLYRNADQVIAVSRDDQRFLQSEYGIANCAYVPNGAALPAAADFDPEPFFLREANDIDPETTIFLTIARFDFPKGYDILLEAVKILAKKHLPLLVQFWWVGDGNLFESMQSKVERHNLGHLIKFWGRRDNIRPLYQAADFFLLPSRWEGLPLTILEAGLQQLPVVGADTWGIREIIRHNENGLLFERENPEALAVTLADILEGKFDPPKLAERLHQLIKKEYSLEQMLSSLEKIYQRFGAAGD